MLEICTNGFSNEMIKIIATTLFHLIIQQHQNLNRNGKRVTETSTLLNIEKKACF